MKAVALLILIVVFATLIVDAVATDHGLIWGIEAEQIIPYRLVETITNQTHSKMIVEDVLIYLKADPLLEMPDNIASFSEVPLLWGTMLDHQGTNFTPFLSALDIYPPIFPSSSRYRLAMPKGNWSLMTQLLTAERLYGQWENDTHWSNSISVVAMGGTFSIITPEEVNECGPIPTIPLPGSIYMKYNWTYSKSDGILDKASGTWETSNDLLEYRMIGADPSTTISNTTTEDASGSSSTTTMTRMQDTQEMVIVLAVLCGIGLVLVVYIWQRRLEMK